MRTIYVIADANAFTLEADSMYHALQRINDINIGLRACRAGEIVVSDIGIKPKRGVTYTPVERLFP